MIEILIKGSECLIYLKSRGLIKRSDPLTPDPLTPYLLACYRYIELNPVRANMVIGPDGYQWSSYHSNAMGHHDDLLTAHDKYIELGADSKARQQMYRQLFSRHMEEDKLKIIRDATQTGTIIGNGMFKQEIARVLKRRVAIFDHGGDRKSRDFNEKKISSTLTP